MRSASTVSRVGRRGFPRPGPGCAGPVPAPRSRGVGSPLSARHPRHQAWPSDQVETPGSSRATCHGAERRPTGVRVVRGGPASGVAGATATAWGPRVVRGGPASGSPERQRRACGPRVRASVSPSDGRRGAWDPWAAWVGRRRCPSRALELPTLSAGRVAASAAPVPAPCPVRRPTFRYRPLPGRSPFTGAPGFDVSASRIDAVRPPVQPFPKAALPGGARLSGRRRPHDGRTSRGAGRSRRRDGSPRG